MANKIDPKVYSAVVRTRRAYPFDLGAFLVRIYAYMSTIGTISMMTLAGYTVFQSGCVASALAISTFLISPQVSRKIDERGQGAVLPLSCAITIVGLALLLAVVQFSLPYFLCFVATVLMGFVPNAQALARTRWTYLLHTGQLGENAPTLKTVYSYEGIIEDFAFLISPAASIALSSAITPIAGMFFGGVCCVLGVVILCLARSTMPEVGWGTAPETEKSGKSRSVFLTSAVVRLLFMIMMFLCLLYGVFDTSAVTFSQQLGTPELASLLLMLESVVSLFSGMLFGMVNLAVPVRHQLTVATLLCGAAYTLLALVSDVPSLFIISMVAAVFYAPLLITCNTTCESAVPSSRLTEAMTWMNAGNTFGMAFGPTIAGFVIDSYGPLFGFDVAALSAFCMVVIAVLGIPLLKKHMG